MNVKRANRRKKGRTKYYGTTRFSLKRMNMNCMSLWLDPSSELARVKAKLMDKRICAHYADYHSSDFYYVYLLLTMFLCSSTWILQVSALGTHHVCLQTYVSKYAYTYASDHEFAFEHKEPRKKIIQCRDSWHWPLTCATDPTESSTDGQKESTN